MAQIDIVTADEIMEIGLELYDKRGMMRKQEENTLRFRSYFGCDPVVAAQIWEDLLTARDAAMQIDTTKCGVTSNELLHALYFLKRYPTETERCGRSGKSPKTIRARTWYFVGRINNLKQKKVCLSAAFWKQKQFRNDA